MIELVNIQSLTKGSIFVGILLAGHWNQAYFWTSLRPLGFIMSLIMLGLCSIVLIENLELKEAKRNE